MRSIRFQIALVGLAGLASLANMSSSMAQSGGESAQNRVNQSRILIIAHRGDSQVAPENTLPAFASAVKAGADMVELDYHHSADGVPMVIHDPTLDRTTNAVSTWGRTELRVDSKKLGELKLLDAGRWFDGRFSNTELPTLSEALDTIQAGSMTLIERKAGDSQTGVQVLRRKKVLDSVVLQAFDWEFLAGCHALAPELVLAALGDKELTAEKLDQIETTGARIVAWSDKGTTPQTITAVHARGWKAWVWTVDDPERIKELVAARIDGIITNRPAATREIVTAATGR